MISYKDPVWMSTTGNYATSSTTGPKRMSLNYVKWNSGARSESAYLVAAFSFRTVCVTFYHEGSRNEHHWICLVKLEAEKILVSFMASKGWKELSERCDNRAVYVCLLVSYEI